MFNLTIIENVMYFLYISTESCLCCIPISLGYENSSLGRTIDYKYWPIWRFNSCVGYNYL